MGGVGDAQYVVRQATRRTNGQRWLIVFKKVAFAPSIPLRTTNTFTHRRVKMDAAGSYVFSEFISVGNYVVANNDLRRLTMVTCVRLSVVTIATQ